MLAEYDAAARHSTDALMALNPELDFTRYVGKKVDDHWEVNYGRINDARDKFLISYRVVSGTTPQQFSVKKCDPREEDNAFYLYAAKAIETALAAFAGATRSYNVAVLPAKSGQLYVYLYPAQTQADVYPIGGDVRYLVSTDGSTILETRQLHKTILDYPDPVKSGEAKDGYKPVMGVHNHILDDVPEDTDVMFAMTRKPSIPERIISWEYTYWVYQDGSIKYEGESAKLFGKKRKK